MAIHIAEIKEKASWDAFVLPYPEKTFLHAWEWGAVQEATGERMWRFGIYDDSTLVGVALIIKITARRGTFLFCPHGPLLTTWSQEIFSSFVARLKVLAKDERAHWIRVSPYIQEGTDGAALFARSGFRNAPIHMHAEITWELDITQSEDVLMRQMRKTTRNLIRKAERAGVEVSIGQSDTLVEEFYTLHEATVARQGFTPFAKRFVAAEVAAFSPDNILVALARHKGIALSGAIIPLYGDSGYYHHGASVASSVPASYLLQWRVIQELKRRGISAYNFWGIAEAGDWKHPAKAWSGLTLFKKGFGGVRKEYLHAHDLPLSYRYIGNWILETLRKQKRSRKSH